MVTGEQSVALDLEQKRQCWHVANQLGYRTYERNGTVGQLG